MAESDNTSTIDTDEPEIVVDRTVADDAPEKGKAVAAAPIRLDDAGPVTAFHPRDTDELSRLVRVIVKGGCVPESYIDKKTNKPDVSKMAVAILTGREIGFGPMMSLKCIMIVRGMPTMWGQGVKAKVMQSGAVEDFREEWVNSKGEPMPLPDSSMPIDKWPSELTARVTVKRRGVATAYVGKFSVGDAKRAHLWANPKKKTYYTFPQDMLMHRAAARVYDRGFADCLMGISIREIIEDGAPEQEKQTTDASFLLADTKAEGQA